MKTHLKKNLQRIIRSKVGQYICVGLAYFLSAEVALLLSLPPSYAAAVWPPAGIALALMLLWGPRVGWAILPARVAMNLLPPIQIQNSFLPLECIIFLVIESMGAILQAYVGYRLTRSIWQSFQPFAKGWGVVKFLFLGGPLSCIIAPSWGMGLLLIFKKITVDSFTLGWLTWWIGDTIGVFIFTPLVYILTQKLVSQKNSIRILNAFSLVAVFLLIILAFNVSISWQQNQLNLTGNGLHELSYNGQTILILISGLLIAGILSIFLFFLNARSAQVEDLVSRRTLELRRLNKNLKSERDQHKETAKSLETLLHIISHDLKEPLRAIHGFSTMVKEEYAQRLDEQGQDFLARISDAVGRMHFLLKDILNLAMARQIKLPKNIVNAYEIVEEVLSQLNPVILKTQAQIKVSPNLPSLRADKTWASQAIYNLVSNALKFSSKGQVPLVEILPYYHSEKSGERRTGMLVRDRGPGIKKEYKESIFLLFRRAVGREIEGTGAGLAIVKEIAERHGGWVRHQAREGGGSEFIIVFGNMP